MKKIVGVFWHTSALRLKNIAERLTAEADIKIYSTRTLEKDRDEYDSLCGDIDKADILILNLPNGEEVCSSIKKYAAEREIKTIYVGANALENIEDKETLEISALANEYYVQNGKENMVNLLRYAANMAGDHNISYEQPVKMPWETLCHPSEPDRYYNSSEDYFRDHPRSDKGTVGILMSRSSLVNEDFAVEKSIIEKLEEKGFSVLPIFAYSWEEPSIGAKGSKYAIEKFCFDKNGNSILDGLVKMTSFFIGGKADTDSEKLLDRLRCPIFKPICSYNMSINEWAENKDGTISDVAWSIALPELEGNIEPLFIGGLENGELDVNRHPIESRIEKLTERVSKWVSLKKKETSEKKAVFILNNNPCASVEASVGGGAKLDTLESVVRIMKSMKASGYTIEDIPESGEDLIKMIMERKAVSEFRWTTTREIVEKGGCIYQMDKETYGSIFYSLSENAQKAITETWGAPPGEEKDGVPPSMVYEGKLCITGIRFGNILVCVQPKRGCAGSRCDGTVCRILHDPHCPPTHQYIATYKYFEHIFKADYIVHVGTHGNLEFLPGKGTALSDDCYPDLCIGTMPNLYIYNADNPPEGTIAKRRALATIVDHMQTVYIPGGLYGELESIDETIQEYEKIRRSEPAQAHQTRHQIIEMVMAGSLKDQIKTEISVDNCDAVIEEVHSLLTIIRNTQIQDGMHIFGDIPSGERRIDLIYGILRYEDGDRKGLRSLTCDLLGLDFEDLIKNSDKMIVKYKKRAGAVLEDIDILGREIAVRLLEGRKIDGSVDTGGLYQIRGYEDNKDLEDIRRRILDLNERIEKSTETENLMKAGNGGNVEPGPSGVVTRGRDDVIPTGRNFYTLDPGTIPTRAAWVIGQRLADTVIEKFMEEEGRCPETFAMYWMCNDVLWGGGEGLAQLLYFLGVKPKWKPNGKINDFEIISLKELKRPRIDISVKVSGILRDNFEDRMDILDRAVKAVAGLDEPDSLNYVKKHTNENIENGMEFEDAATRIFGARPGTYLNGITLQIYASAWKDRSEMLDIFTFFNGYSYGRSNYGKQAYKALQNSLKTVDITYNKVMTDEHDLLGCCTYYGVQGGMTAAARQLSGKDVKTYYGDSRESLNIQVRTMADELNRVVRSKLLNPKWIEGMKKHGYKGAGDISKRIGRVYGWEATTDEVADWVFDEITRTYVENEENNRFFKENNPWALEEMERRLIEAYKRGLWDAPDELIGELQDNYLELEGILEESSGSGNDSFQGGSIDVSSIEELTRMQGHLKGMRDSLK